MKQMKVSEASRVEFDYEKKGVPRAVCELRPVVYREGTSYRCILGPDMKAAISGEGDSPDAAIESWMISLRQRLDEANAEDEVALYARDVLKTSVNDVW